MKYIAYVVLAIIFLVSCGKDSDSGTSASKIKTGILPLAVNNTWFYVDSSITVNSLQKSPKSMLRNRLSRCQTVQSLAKNTQSYDYVDSSLVKIDGTRTITVGQKLIILYKIKWFTQADTDNEDQSYWLERQEADGLYIYGFQVGEKDTLVKSMDLKYPVKEGDSWIRKVADYSATYNNWSVDFEEITCISTNTKFETPMGTYTCIVYSSSSGYDEYYVPKLGLVGNVGYADNYISLKSCIYDYKIK